MPTIFRDNLPFAASETPDGPYWATRRSDGESLMIAVRGALVFEWLSLVPSQGDYDLLSKETTP